MFFHFPYYAAEYTSYVAASPAVVSVSHARPLTGWVKAGRKDQVQTTCMGNLSVGHSLRNLIDLVFEFRKTEEIFYF